MKVVSTVPNPEAGGPPLVGCQRLLIQYIHSYPPYWRTFFHPQPQYVPFRGVTVRDVRNLVDSQWHELYTKLD
jgi:hypothetical protein